MRNDLRICNLGAKKTPFFFVIFVDVWIKYVVPCPNRKDTINSVNNKIICRLYNNKMPIKWCIIDFFEFPNWLGFWHIWFSCRLVLKIRSNLRQEVFQHDRIQRSKCIYCYWFDRSSSPIFRISVLWRINEYQMNAHFHSAHTNTHNRNICIIIFHLRVVSIIFGQLVFSINTIINWHCVSLFLSLYLLAGLQKVSHATTRIIIHENGNEISIY